ncbi:uncharacterized protein BYT42DRAFT_6526 [Radiomyces spectabilis]|uniref:uncharacterized protein n=1 Tax=Radiomyces spectabilis TaxID=64574 RepID=UPI00221FD3AD|nr:uncharacterized protein BYT42DRAFT_6526 [Radiomyces spectabilis]KAI8393441.1 hypothetical protein BYT42DRAFT_6526 [Radiomyces spectabilis]
MTAGVAEEEYEETLFLPTAPATDKVPDRSIRSASVGSTSSTKDRLPSSYSAVTPVRELPPPSLPTGYSSPKDPSEDNDEENIALDFFRNIQSGGSPNDSFISPLMEDDIVHGSSTEDRLFEQVDTSQVAADTSKGVEENEISPPSTSAQQRLFHLPSPASSKPRATELPTGGRSPKRHRSVDHAPDSVGEKRQRTLSGMFNMDRRVQSEAIASGSTRTIRPHADGDAITADASETIPLMDRNDTSSPRLSIRGPRRRNIASLMSDSETNRSYLFKTLDQEISATWDFEKIQRAFKLAADIPSEPCRVSLDEYTQSNMDPHSASSAAILKNPDNPKYSFYITKRQSSGRGSLAHEINVIDLTA